MVERDGALFNSLTVTVKVLVALKGGVPLSVTLVVNTTPELGPCASVGVQVMMPLELMQIGRASCREREEISVAAGSLKKTVLVRGSVANSLTDWLVMG